MDLWKPNAQTSCASWPQSGAALLVLCDPVCFVLMGSGWCLPEQSRLLQGKGVLWEPHCPDQPGFCVIFPNETHPFCSSCTWCFNQIQNTLRSLMGMKSHYTELITFNFNCGEKGFIHVVYKIKLFWCLFHFTIENLDTPLGQMGIDWLSYTPVLGSLGWKQKVKMPFLGSFPLQLIKAEGCISRRKCSVGIFTAPLSQDSLDIWYKPAVKDQETCSAHCLLTYKQCPIKDSFYCWKAIKE